MHEYRLCTSPGCPNKRAGKSHYCAPCRHRRRMDRQDFYRGKFPPDNTDLLPEPPTSLNWLDSFSPWAKSGLSYAEYQIKDKGTELHC